MPQQDDRNTSLGFFASSRALLQEKGGLSKAHTSDGFDPNAYKLMKRFDYDFSKPPFLVIKKGLMGLMTPRR